MGNKSFQLNSRSLVALVTGGTGGLGTAICQALAAEGAKVIAAYNKGGNHEQAKNWQLKQKELGFDIDIAYGDVSDFNCTQKMVSSLLTKYVSIDILVNNAGITRDGRFVNMNLEQWEDVRKTNYDSLFNTTKHVLPNMIENKFGRIINISSVNGQKGQFGQSNYSAAKAAVHGFTKALAQEVASLGVTVNTISPGYIATEMVMAVPEKVREKIIMQIPVGRLGEPSEIGRSVVFLSAIEGGYITGSNLSVNGGQHMY